MLVGDEKGSLPVVATVFDKLNQVYKEYLEAEQSYTVVCSWIGKKKYHNHLPYHMSVSIQYFVYMQVFCIYFM